MESILLNNNTIMGVDAITFLIIAIIVLIFAMALFMQFGYAVTETKRRKPFAKVIKVLNGKDAVVIDEQPSELQSWFKSALYFESEDQHLVATKKDKRFQTAVPVYQLLCREPMVNGKGIPALLTSIGVAGTFLGITLGLSEFNFDDVGQNSGSLVQSAVVLLEGMKTAFYTSLAGLASSAIFMIIVQVHGALQNKRTSKINNALRGLLVEIPATYYLQKLVAQTGSSEQFELQRESALAMQSVGQQLGGFLQKFEEMGNNFNGEKMAAQIAEAVDRTMRDSVAPVLTDFKEELKAVREFKEDNSAALLTQLVDTIKQELIVPVTTELKHTSDAVSTSNELSKQLNENVALVLKQVGDTVETIDKFNSETMQRLQAFAQSLRDVLEGFKADTEGTMTRITSEVQNVLDMSVKGMTAQREAFDESAQRAAVAFEGMGQKLEDAFDESSQRAAAAFESMGQKLEDTLDKRAQSEKLLFTATEERIESLLNQTSKSFEEQNSVLKQTGDEASRLMESARKELELGLGDIDEKVIGMSRTVQTELESFREQYQTNLTDFFTQQNNLLEDTLGNQRNNLVEVVDKFKQVFTEEYQTRHNLLQELTLQHAQLQDSASTIQKLAKAIGLTETSTMSELQDIANTMGRNVGELKKEYIMASSAFKEITEGLPKAMEQYFKEANQSTEVFFKSFDDAAGRIHNRLAQAADFLVDARLQDMSYEKSEAV
jgi:AraC-like DNA-binding protein